MTQLHMTDETYITADQIMAVMSKIPPGLRGGPPLPVAMVGIEKIMAHPKNWRTHPEVQIRALRQSIEEFGIVQPCTFNVRTGHLLDGHLRLEIARADGQDVLFCRVVDWDEHKEERFLLSCDPITMLAGQDDERLADLLSRHIEDEEGVPAGWDEEDVRKLLEGGITDAEEAEFQQLEAAAKEVPDAPLPDAIPARTKVGDVYRVAGHVIVVDDNSEPGNIAIALAAAGVQAVDLVFTDPPYELHADDMTFPDADGSRKQRGTLAGVKEAKIDHFNPFTMILNNMRYWFGWKGEQCGASERFAAFFFCNDPLISAYLDWSVMQGGNSTLLFWKKQQPIPKGGSHWMDLEYLPYIKRGGHWNNSDVAPDCDRNHCLMYDRASIKEEGDTSDHNTPKPVPLIANQLRLTTKPGDVVADMFGGRGSTMIACEQTGRRCIFMEHNPKYADGALRWIEMMTGETAHLLYNIYDEGNTNENAR